MGKVVARLYSMRKKREGREGREAGSQAGKRERKRKKNAGAFVLRLNERENIERHCCMPPSKQMSEKRQNKATW